MSCQNGAGDREEGEGRGEKLSSSRDDDPVSVHLFGIDLVEEGPKS